MILSLVACSTKQVPPMVRAPVVPWPPPDEGTVRPPTPRLPVEPPAPKQKHVTVPKYKAQLVPVPKITPQPARVPAPRPVPVPKSVPTPQTVSPPLITPHDVKPNVRLPDTPEGWSRLDGCTFVNDKFGDGDSFHVAHSGANYHFRLYFVDTPETDKQYGRYLNQAEEWGISPERVLEEGERAKAFTVRQLSKPFTVFTKWQKLPSKNNDPRTYAVVYTVDGACLGEKLVSAGMARVHGLMTIPFPTKEGRKAYVEMLERLEQKAKADKIGVYGDRLGVNASESVTVLK